MMQHHTQARDAAKAAGKMDAYHAHSYAVRAHRTAKYLPRDQNNQRPNLTVAVHSAWNATQKADDLGKSDTYGGIVDNFQQGDPDVRIQRVREVVKDRVANAGTPGLSLDKIMDVVKGYGRDVVAHVLTTECGKGGSMTFKKGMLKFRG